MNKIYTIVRIVFGIMIIGSGAMMLFTGEFPTEYENANATIYMDALEHSGFFVPLLAITKIICGIALVSKRFIPMALVIFMPISVNMVLFHLTLEPVTGVGAYIIFIMNLFLMFKHKEDYASLLQAKSLRH